jgi:monoamine oxidase
MTTTHLTSAGAALDTSPSGSDDRARHVVVIGAGLGGLAAAIRLRHQGYRVTLLERQAGRPLRAVAVRGFPVRRPPPRCC